MRHRKVKQCVKDELHMDQRYLKRQKLCDLDSSDLISIVHKVNVEQFSHSDTAYLHRVDPQLVTRIIKKSK